MINKKLLAEICEVAGAPGHEQRVRKIVLREVKKLVDEIKIDNMGNIVAIKKGKENKRGMIAAHMDEIGLLLHILMTRVLFISIPLVALIQKP